MIPYGLDPDLCAAVAPYVRVTILQHGFDHLNKAGAAPSEFSPADAPEQVAARLADGWARLDGFERRLPVYVPPWNSLTPNVEAALVLCGNRAVSAWSQLSSPGRVDTHVDLMRWRGEPRFAGRERVLARLTAQLHLRRQPGEDPLAAGETRLAPPAHQVDMRVDPPRTGQLAPSRHGAVPAEDQGRLDIGREAVPRGHVDRKPPLEAVQPRPAVGQARGHLFGCVRGRELRRRRPGLVQMIEAVLQDGDPHIGRHGRAEVRIQAVRDHGEAERDVGPRGVDEEAAQLRPRGAGVVIAPPQARTATLPAPALQLDLQGPPAQHGQAAMRVTGGGTAERRSSSSR